MNKAKGAQYKTTTKRWLDQFVDETKTNHFQYSIVCVSIFFLIEMSIFNWNSQFLPIFHHFHSISKFVRWIHSIVKIIYQQIAWWLYRNLTIVKAKFMAFRMSFNFFAVRCYSRKKTRHNCSVFVVIEFNQMNIHLTRCYLFRSLLLYYTTTSCNS